MRILVSTLAVLTGIVLDFLFGDPRVSWHPVCLIGNLIGWLEKKLRRVFGKGKKRELWAGRCLVLLVLLIGAGSLFVILDLIYRVHILFGFVVESILSWLLLATKSLKKESMAVYDALECRGLEEGRKAVSMIVGRDTQQLTKEGVIKATVETIAENSSDGCIAPMFYLFIGGVWLGFVYKCINTMDSMVGYKNEAYLNFGRAAAKLDDVVNYIPARLSAGFLILASCFWGFNKKEAVRIYRRDRYNHASPNSAQTESVMAGALGVQLAGNAYYFGKEYTKPTIGDATRPIACEDIKRANRLLYGSVLLAATVFAMLKGLLFLCINMAEIYTIMNM